MNTHSKDRPDEKSGSPLRSGKTEGPTDHRARYIRNSKTISGRLHDEMVMMDINQGKYFSLNPVATRIWDLLEEPLSVDDLCLLLIDEYEVEPGQCQREVNEHLEEMERLGLVLPSEE